VIACVPVADKAMYYQHVHTRASIPDNRSSCLAWVAGARNQCDATVMQLNQTAQTPCATAAYMLLYQCTVKPMQLRRRHSAACSPSRSTSSSSVRYSSHAAATASLLPAHPPVVAPVLHGPRQRPLQLLSCSVAQQPRHVAAAAAFSVTFSSSLRSASCGRSRAAVAG
jgi:hypothetical protein